MDALLEKGRSVFAVEDRKAVYDEAQSKLPRFDQSAALVALELAHCWPPTVAEGLPAHAGHHAHTSGDERLLVRGEAVVGASCVAGCGRFGWRVEM